MRRGLAGGLFALCVCLLTWVALAGPAASTQRPDPAPPRPEAPPAAVPPGTGTVGREAPPGEDDPEAWALGRELHLRTCASCHGTDGEGSTRGPSLVGVGAASAHFQLTTGRMPPNDLDDIPSRGEQAFDDEEVDALVRYVASLGGGPPIPQVGRGDVASGLLLYVENCAACHSATATGAAKVARVAAPSLYESTPVQIAEAIRVGPNLMPHFPEGVLDDDEVDDVVAYVQHLQVTEDRGGLALGRLGPAAEAVAAWTVFLLLLLVARRLGRAAR